MSDTVRRVALLSPAWPPGTVANGIVTYVQCLRDGFRELGVECKVVTPTSSPSDEEAEHFGNSLSQHNSFTKLATRASWRLFPSRAEHIVPVMDAMYGCRRLERKWPFDVLETEETFGKSRWIARAVTAPVIVRLHGPWFLNGSALGVAHDAAYHAQVAAEGRAIASATAITAPCRDVLEQVRQHYQLPLPNAVVIPNPGSEPIPGEKWNRETAEPGHVLFVGRFDRHKGGDIAIQAFSLLAERLPLLKLTMVGPDRGFVDDAGKRWSFPDYVAANVPEAHRSRIEFLGHMDRNAVMSLRRRASVVISASRYENFAMAMLEALSQGCPVICPDAGGFPEMVRDGETGLIFPAGNAHALADRIEQMVTSPARAAELGERALRDYRERYLPRRIAEQTVEFYREVCQKHFAQTRIRRHEPVTTS